MEEMAEEFVRRRRALARRGAVGRGRRYPEEMVTLAVRYAESACVSGQSEAAVAERLGVSVASLRRWRTVRDPETPGLHEVVLSPEPGGRLVTSGDTQIPAGRSLAVVTPDGFRIEGVEAAAILPLLEALRR